MEEPVVVIGVLFVAGIVLFCLAMWLWTWARTGRQEAGLPEGRVTYVDTGAWKRAERPLFSNQHRLTGRPDYLVRVREGVIPVEVKSGTAPARPHEAHVLQLAAYCLLVEEVEARPVPYGIVKYDDKAFEIDYTPALRERLLGTLDAIRADLEAPDAQRNHHDVRRCAACGYREECEERL
ncbi:MAG: CRISPR-associated protein Cas4 [Anaerolineae bacterium]|nr:CRISPR-associated protein Cas4 [Anaerolineae bacterium]